MYNFQTILSALSQQTSTSSLPEVQQSATLPVLSPNDGEEGYVFVLLNISPIFFYWFF